MLRNYKKLEEYNSQQEEYVVVLEIDKEIIDYNVVREFITSIRDSKTVWSNYENSKAFIFIYKNMHGLSLDNITMNSIRNIVSFFGMKNNRNRVNIILQADNSLGRFSVQVPLVTKTENRPHLKAALNIGTLIMSCENILLDTGARTTTLAGTDLIKIDTTGKYTMYKTQEDFRNYIDGKVNNLKDERLSSIYNGYRENPTVRYVKEEMPDDDLFYLIKHLKIILVTGFDGSSAVMCGLTKLKSLKTQCSYNRHLELQNITACIVPGGESSILGMNVFSNFEFTINMKGRYVLLEPFEEWTFTSINGNILQHDLSKVKNFNNTTSDSNEIVDLNDIDPIYCIQEFYQEELLPEGLEVDDIVDFRDLEELD